MGNAIQYAIVAIILLAATIYAIRRTVRTLRRAKKDGKCAGCPLADACAQRHNCQHDADACCH